MNLRSFFNQKFTINNAMIIIGVLFVSVVALAAYYIGSLWSSDRQQAPLQSDIPPSSTMMVISATETIESVQPSTTPTPEIMTSETPILIPTETVLTTATATAEQTQIPLITATGANATQAAQQTISKPADQAKLVKNVDTKNGGYFAPKKQFTKTWVIQNTGTTTWNKKYDLVYISGAAMTDQVTIPLANSVKPGKIIAIEIEQTAPKTPGVYQGFWMLRNEKGKTFGTGPEADQPLAVKATVLNITKGNAYDFLLEYCEAIWWNSEGETINCQGVPRQTSGFVILDPNPSLETASSDLPALWVHPYHRADGVISGKYPSYLVQDGDHFKAQVGCIRGNTNCNITFKLLYNNGSGPNIFLGTWQELYGGGITRINLDLSPLAGEQVQFILRTVVSNNVPEDANGFWLIPRIVNDN